MSFLSLEDYKVVCCPADLDVISQSDPANRERAERAAMEEIAGYVRSRYDIAAAFAASGPDRNDLLVQIAVAISLWWLGQWLGMVGSDARELLYKNAIDRLKDIQNGKFTPDFPEYPLGDDGSGLSIGDSMRFGTMTRQHYDW